MDWIAISIIVVILALLIIGSGEDEEKTVSTIDNTAEDIDALATMIKELPDTIQNAIADGVISVSIGWEEITRDEDDYPTIKPYFKIQPAKENA